MADLQPHIGMLELLIRKFVSKSPRFEKVGNGRSGLSRWIPFALRSPFLLATLFVTIALMVVLQTFFLRSHEQDGLLFFPDAKKIPFSTSFWYRYFPTIVSVCYSLTWSWIDLDMRRIEPYRQLSRPNGAEASTTVLLHYTVDLLSTVPFKAARRKHWAVLLSSSALMIISWGVTPLQAAIFATHTISKSSDIPISISDYYIPIFKQNSLTANYTYSVSSIAWLNESLPPYMSRQAMFAPFALESSVKLEESETWTSTTTMYSVDIECESALLKTQHIAGESELTFESSQGCQIPVPFGPTGNDTVGSGIYGTVKDFSALYAGFEDTDGFAHYYICEYCPANASDTFFAVFATNKISAYDNAGPVTRLFCTPNYYQQPVKATVSAVGRQIIAASAIGNKTALPIDMFNTTQFMWEMSAEQQRNAVRGPIPSRFWPDQTQNLAGLPLTADNDTSVMVGLAIGADQHELSMYMDPEELRQSYQAAYRLLFARAMADVLPVDFLDARVVTGTRSYITQAVYMVPLFTYVVQGLLGLAAILVVIIHLVSMERPLNLTHEPSSLAFAMQLASADHDLLNALSGHERTDDKKLATSLDNFNFRLERCGDSSCLRTIRLSSGSALSRASDPAKTDIDSHFPVTMELRIHTGLLFLVCQVALIIVLAYFFVEAKSNGLPLPSRSRVLRQLLENYLPTALATIIESVWVTLNRLACVLQPFEELQKGKAVPERSLNLEYTAWPSQLVVTRALLKRHFMLAALCAMALLANVLAVAFSGMFNEEEAIVSSSSNLTMLLSTNHLTPNISDQGLGQDQFYYAMSNFTSKTSMPAWTDNAAFYVPVMAHGNLTDAESYTINTTAFGIEPQCNRLHQSSNASWSIDLKTAELDGGFEGQFGLLGNLTASFPTRGQDDVLTCQSPQITIPGFSGNNSCATNGSDLALEIVNVFVDQANVDAATRCGNMLFAAWIRKAPSKDCSDGTEFNDTSATVIACAPRLWTSDATINVATNGVVNTARIQQKQYLDVGTFQQNASALLSLSNAAVFSTIHTYTSFGNQWHTDSFPSDWNNYVIRELDQSDRFLSPVLPPPPPEDAVRLFEEMHRKLFAIWFSINHASILPPAQSPLVVISGSVQHKQTRIFISTPMFLLAEVILSLYVGTTLAFYARSPGRHLVRLPTTLASVIAMFAASRAIERFGRKGGDAHDSAEPGDGQIRYGYGVYEGTDGKLHEGIEQEPYVMVHRRRGRKSLQSQLVE